jgi:hypothetical protein
MRCTEVPTIPKDEACDMVRNPGEHKNHTCYTAENYLRTWTFPQKLEEIRERVEQVLEEGLPDQRRRMLLNQEDGILDDRFADDIALGMEVENPFQRWSKKARDTCRVAICIDATIIWHMPAEELGSRMVVAAGLAAALEAQSYEVMVVAARLTALDGKPRSYGHGAKFQVSVLKGEDEPLTTSGFAALSDTDLTRLLYHWEQGRAGYTCAPSNSEWRELTESDLFIHLNATESDLFVHGPNQDGLPKGESARLIGDDVLSLPVSRYADVEAALVKVESFFQKMAEE